MTRYPTRSGAIEYLMIGAGPWFGRACLAGGFLLLLCVFAAGATEIPQPALARSEDKNGGLPPLTRDGPTSVKVLQLIQGEPRRRRYPMGLTTLLEHINNETSIRLDTEPEIIQSFEDPALFSSPFVYVNAADRENWELTNLEQRRLREYLERGGFLYIDAGISPSFLRDSPFAGQHHSFGEWEEAPAIRDAFKSVFPAQSFQALPRNNPLYRSFYQGLPDTDKLPDTVREYVINEKWPDGTYAAVALRVRGRVAVLCTPIVAMGWGKDPLGNWVTTIGFRTREGARDLDVALQTAAYSGERFEVRREDGKMDVIYCQPAPQPAWVREPDGRWRVFRYYHSREISEFAHVFYTQLGTNILIYALTQ